MLLKLTKRASQLLHRGLLSQSFVTSFTRRFSSTLPNQVESRGYSMEDVEIPVPVPGGPKGFVAGRLFHGIPEGKSPKYPPIICVHGWGDTLTSFDYLIPQIVGGKNLTVLSFDMTGHGKSSHPPGPFVELHHETMLTILRLIRHYKWEKVTLLGHSFGGLVSLSFASLFPDLTHSFVGLDILLPQLAFAIYDRRMTPIWTKMVLEDTLELEKKLAGGRAPPEYTREEMIDRMMQGRLRQGGCTPDVCEMLVDRGSIVQPNGKLVFSNDPRWNNFFFAGLLSLRSNINLYAENIKCPTCLIIMNTQPDEVLGDLLKFKPKINDLQDQIRKSASKLEVTKVTVHHHGHMSNPEVVSPIINNFLKSNL